MKYKCSATQTLTLLSELDIEAESKQDARKKFDDESMSLDDWDIVDIFSYNVEIEEV
jgi:hypothetical protein